MSRAHATNRAGLVALSFFACTSAVVACAAILDLPDPSLDEGILVDGGGSSGGNGDSSTNDGALDDGDVDGGDGGSTRCLKDTVWKTFTPIAELNSPQLHAIHASLTSDELVIMFNQSSTLDLAAPMNLFRAIRKDASAPFALPAELLPSPRNSPVLISGGGHLYFSEPGTPDAGAIGDELRRSPRLDGGYTTSAAQIGLESPGRVVPRTLILDANSDILYFHSEEGSFPSVTTTIRRATRAGSPNSWNASVAISGLADAGAAAFPVVRSDDQEIFYAVQAGSGWDLYTARRPKAADSWNKPELMSEFGSGTVIFPQWLSDDGCRLYYSKSNGTRLELHVATRAFQ